MDSDQSRYIARFLATSRVALGLDIRTETPHPETATAADDRPAKAMRSYSRVDDFNEPPPPLSLRAPSRFLRALRK
jgi:hypothetical protein